MAFVKTVSRFYSPMTLFFELKEMLVAQGWTVMSSRGLSGDYGAGDRWVTAADVTGLSWTRLQMPGGTNEVVFFRNGSSAWEDWSLGYSPEAMTGGDNTTPPTPVIGWYVLSTTNINKGGSWSQSYNRTCVIVQDEAPWGFWVCGWLATTGVGEIHFSLEPLEADSVDAADDDPYVLIVFRGADIAPQPMYEMSTTVYMGGTWLYGSASEASDTFYAVSYAWAGDTTPGIGPRLPPGDKKLLMLPIWVGNTTSGIKGKLKYRKYSPTFGIANGSSFTLDTDNDYIYQDHLLVPWDGTAMP